MTPDDPRGDGELLPGVVDPQRVLQFERLERVRELQRIEVADRALHAALDDWFRLDTLATNLESDLRRARKQLEAVAGALEALGCRRPEPSAEGTVRWLLPGTTELLEVGPVVARQAAESCEVVPFQRLRGRRL